jgi:hypothetical protein
MKRFSKIGFLALAIVVLSAFTASSASAAEFDKYGLESVGATTSTNQAGAHPDVTLKFKLNTDPQSRVVGGRQEPYALTKNIRFELPAGLLGNLNAIDKCPMAQFINALQEGGCPFSSQVGIAKVGLYPFANANFNESIFLLAPPEDGDVVARLGLYVFAVAVTINVRVRSDSDYGLTASVEGAPSNAGLVTSEATLWGVPGDPSHNNRRLLPTEYGSSVSPPREFGRPAEPFLTNPTTCGEPLSFGFAVNSYQLPDLIARKQTTMTSKDGTPAPITGCEALAFEPSFEATPTSHAAGAPTGLDVDLKVPQDEAVGDLATSQLRDAHVTFPKGMTINPDAADGLQACTPQQAGYKEVHKTECPLGSTLGTASFDVPALPEPIEGTIYQRSPEAGHLVRIWLTADEQGVHVALPGEVELNPSNGQISSVFLDNPQVPLRELKLHFKVGPRAPLTNPPSCGTFLTHSEFAPWSGNSASSEDSPMEVSENCNYSTGIFNPSLSAGSTSLDAGAFTNLITDITRQDGEENVEGLNVSLPLGLSAKFAGVGICSDAQAATGTCPASSQVGTTTIAAGPGITPLWIPQPGKAPTAVYLAGPYKGAPFSLLVKVPAQAGPFDLGDVLTRAALYVDPETAQGTVKSDPLPQYLQGIPVAYRQIHVAVNRAGFALNPTSCEPKVFKATLTSAEGKTAEPSSSFQVGECGQLSFGPKLALSLKGDTKRGGLPSLKAVLTFPKGHQANIARAQVTLPHSEFLEQSHIQTVCTRVQFQANACPKRSIYGRARAFTPLFDKPLEGPVYLRSSSHQLPDLVADLNGQIHVALDGRIDTGKNGGIRNTFEAVPDAPVSRFVLEMQGQKKGLLVNSEDLCRASAGKRKANVSFGAQNGRIAQFQTLVDNSCGKKGAHKGKKGHKSGKGSGAA